MRILCVIVALALVPASAFADDDVAPPAPPEMRDFFPELARNFWRLRDPRNLSTLVGGSILVGGAFAADDDVEDYLGEKRRAKAAGDIGHVLGNPVTLGGSAAAALLVAYRGDDPARRAFAFDLAQGFVVNDLLTRGLKAAIDRERPSGENRNSFPSGHASASFTVAAVIDHHYGTTPSVIAYCVATFVALSRLEKNKHHLSDVAAGALQGIIVGRSVTRRAGDVRRVRITPIAGPGEVGAMVAIRW